MDPDSDPVYLNGGRSGQQHSIWPLPARFEGPGLISADIDRVSNLPGRISVKSISQFVPGHAPRILAPSGSLRWPAFTLV